MITTITFQNMPVNPSIAIGDFVYYVTFPVGVGGFMTADNIGVSSYNPVGQIVSIVEDNSPPQIQTQAETTVSTFTISVESLTAITPPGVKDYIFFLKDSCCNTTSIKGYYNMVTFKNNSDKPAELFATSCGFVESSK